VYFEVAHDAGRPFIVHAGPKTVTVLGTKFSVRRDGDRVEVAVVDGRVRVENANVRALSGPSLPILTRGDIVVAQGKSTMFAPNSVEAVAGDLAWREGMLSFDQVTLTDAAGEFNRYNRKKLIVTGEPAQMRIGGSFQASNVDVFARLLRRTYGLKVDDDGKAVRISQ
jgi:transmembrane sensor